MNYEDISLEECFVLYHTRGVACQCNADESKVKFMEE